MTRPMKDSGIEWIGEIPQGWNVNKLKYSADINRQRLNEQAAPDFEFEYIDISSVNEFGEIAETTKLSFEESPSRARMVVNKGDTIVSTVRTYLKAIAYIDKSESYICSTGFCVLSPYVGIDSKYLYYQVHSDYFVQRIVSESVGVSYPAINSNRVGEILIIVPNLNEQKAIANYLDQKCAQIDKVITSKQKTNELLKERRQSIIYEAVTKGLDRNAPMKDSGIEWIGKIPLEWGLEKLKFSAEINPRADIALKDEDDVSFVPMDNLKFGFHTTTLVPYERVKKGYVPFSEGDILIAKVTPCFENGNLAIASNLRDGVGFGSTEITVIRAENIHVRYLYYYFQNPKFIERGTYDMYGVAGLKRLPTSFFANTCIPITTLKEQKTISDYLDDKCGEIDRLIRANNFTIEKLIEYRQSIIFEAVTGKMEVPRNCGRR